MKRGGVQDDGWVKTGAPIEVWYPRAAVTAKAINVPAGAPWTWTAYSQIVAATANDFTPQHVNMGMRFSQTQAISKGLDLVEIEIAKGAAGFEVNIGRWIIGSGTFINNPGVGTQALCAVGYSMPMGPTVIPAGTRLSVKGRHLDPQTGVSGQGMTGGLYIVGYDGAVPVHHRAYGFRPHLTGIHHAISAVYPDGAVINVPAGIYPAYGAITQVVAALPKTSLIWGVGVTLDLAGAFQVTDAPVHFELYKGAAGFEIPLARIPCPLVALTQAGTFWLRRPVLFRQGTRFSVAATDGAGQAFNTVWFAEEV